MHEAKLSAILSAVFLKNCTVIYVIALLLAWVPYDIKGEEFSHSHFYRMANMWNVGGVK